MNPDLLKTYDDRYAKARARVADALSGTNDRPSARILRWIVGNGINPHNVFSWHYDADQLRSAEGAATLLNRIDRAFRDGKICFPETEAHGPYIHIGSSAQDPETPKIFHTDIRANGHGEDVIEGHRIIGFCPDLDAFIAAFEAREREREVMYRELLEEPEP
ncbi:MAG: hypothetical protein KC466_20860 [Myxococcales bacterium]|nr:hypothetical protein [Myxococcales bacterium]